MSQKTFFIDKLGVDPGKCLPGRYMDYSDHPCQDLCPNKAITLKPLEIDYGLCDDCGICGGACPSGALSVKESFLKELFRQTTSEEDLELKIRCTRAAGSCAAVMCLAALDYAFFVDLCISGAKNLTLLSGNCESCRVITGGGIIRSSVDTANNLLFLYERNERVILAESADRQDLESGSRRAMFRGLGRTISRFIPELEDTAHGPDQGPEPGRRQRSIRIIERLEKERRRTTPDMPMPFTGREIDASRCDICGGSPMCVSFCPTDALEFFADRGGVAITFAASRCIGCELCQGACHKAAVSSFPLQSGQLEELWSARTLASFEAHECDGCGRVSAVARAGLCQDCQERERKLGWDVV